MGTRWKSEGASRRPKPPRIQTDMATKEHSKRPQIYVHFEFGVSYSPTRSCNRRSVTYMSRSLRDQANSSPPSPVPQLPRSSTTPHNYLAAPGSHGHVHERTNHPRSSSLNSQQYRYPSPSSQQRYSGPQTETIPRSHPSYLQPTDPRRPSRASNRSHGSSQERGRSAPPQVIDRPWDAEPEPMSCSALPGQDQRDRSSDRNSWKPLPAAPSTRRQGGTLRDEQAAWSARSWSGGQRNRDDVSYDQDYDDDEAWARSQRNPFVDPLPAAITVTSPNGRRTSRHREERGEKEDSAPKVDLSALSSAMMTVDNGFESQWWYQGERQVIPKVDTGELFVEPTQLSTATPPASAPHTPITAPATTMTETPVTIQSLGWAVARESPTSPRGQFHDMPVSPITEVGSPTPQYGRMYRRMTARSEELFFYA